MIDQLITLYNYGNGVIMIAIIGLVFIILAVALVLLMNSGSKKKN